MTTQVDAIPAPTDFSDAATEAVEVAASLAQRLDADLVRHAGERGAARSA